MFNFSPNIFIIQGIIQSKTAGSYSTNSEVGIWVRNSDKIRTGCNSPNILLNCTNTTISFYNKDTDLGEKGQFNIEGNTYYYVAFE